MRPRLIAEPPARVMLTADAVGGVLTQTTDLARAFARRGIAVDLVLVGPTPSAEARRLLSALDGVRIVETGLPLEWMSESAAPVIDAARRLADLATELAPDVAHLSNPAHAAAGDWHVPLVVTLHSCMATWWQAVKPDAPPPHALAWRTRLTRAGLAAADAAIVPSAPFGEAAAAVYGTRRFTVVANGRARPAAVAARARRGAMASGRLWDEGKNMAALDAAAGLTDVPIAVAGATDGPNGARQTFAHARLLGALDADGVRDALAGARSYVSTALYEPFGLGVLEAAQAGCALVLADIPTLRRLWDGAALFVDPRDPAAIAAAIERVERTPALATALGAAARRRAATMTDARMAADTLAVHALARASARSRLVHLERGVA